MTEFNVATKENPKVDNFYVLEESSFCSRLCLGTIHDFKMTMSEGPTAGGKKVALFDRPLACPLHQMKCCCFQSLTVTDGENNSPLGSVKETFYFCVPEFAVRNETGEISHFIHMPICCGCLPNICAEGCCRVPFYIYKADDREKEAGKIVKIWGSLYTELMGMHQFECDFPPDATPQQKAVFSGATFLINELFFRAKDNNSTPIDG